MAEDKLPVEREIIVATEPAGTAQKSLGRPMLMVILLIAAAFAGIAIFVAMRSN